MTDSSQASQSGTRGICSDCGASFAITSRIGRIAHCCDACQSKRLESVTAAPAGEVHLEKAAPWFRSRKLWLCIVVLAALATAGFVWRQPLLGQYHHWTQNLHARRAVQAFQKQDYEHAVIDGRRALEFDPFDIETNRIIAKSREAQGSTEALGWRSRLNTIKPGDVENAIAWARDALNAGAVETAENALTFLRAADRNSADYHDISAHIAMSKADSAKAETHWREAVRLAPASEDFRLRLATLQIQSRSDVTRESAKDTLATLAEIPRHRLAALRPLIEDAMNHQKYPHARELADQLVASPDANFPERIARLSALRAQNAPDAPQYLEQLRDESLQDPRQLATLLLWMNSNELPLLVSDWVSALPPALVSQPPVCLAIADAYGRDRDWPKLRAFVEKAVWKDYEHIRLAHLSHALENFGNVIAGEATWGRAIVECHEKPDRLAALVRLAQSWKSEQREEITLRKLSADESTPLWVLDALWVIARKAGDSEELHRLSRLIVKARPKNPEARNNFIRISLLRRQDEGATHQLAEAFFKENPEDIRRAVTYALSLFFQGRILNARATLASFPDTELREPENAFYYGMFLQASADSKNAQEYLTLAKGNVLLHDEEELLARVKRESRFNTLTPEQKPPVQPKKNGP